MTGRLEHHVLVVEEDVGMREGVLVPGLKEAGFNVVGAGSAAEAYRCMLTQDFSVFILDIDLPGESGLAIAKHLRTMTEAGIILTGHRRESDHIYGLDVGADVCITKPIDIDMLAASPGETVPRDTIISRLARDIHDFDPHRLEMLVHRLRRKVLSATSEQLPLNAVRGIGYVLLPGT